MSEPASISSGIAARYAKAVFELADQDKQLVALERDLDSIEGALADSAEFRDLISSPIYSREEQARAVAAIAARAELTPLLANTLGLMASKRRLFVLPQMAAALRSMIADRKGEVTADVTAAKVLSDDQKAKLAASLKASLGKEIKINMAVDESLIGGLIVKVGSKMIDTSIRSRLAALQNTMKEVG